jgi:ADP-ribosylglycohydrolase
MQKEGIHHCGHCTHFNNSLCRLRNERITIPNWTTCKNWNKSELTPNGVLFAILGEARNGAIAYRDIPYYNGLRVDAIQVGSNDTSVFLKSQDGYILNFKDVCEYLDFYEDELNKKKGYVIGGIIGDIIGSVFEWHNVKTIDFPLFNNQSNFTDDSVLTFATMDSILNQLDYSKAYQNYGRKYPRRGYGGNFKSWIYTENPKPYNSWGNGSAMRVSPVGWAYNSLEEVLTHAKKSAEVTHNHPEGIKGAQAVATAIFLARNNKSKIEIKQFLTDRFNYNLDRKISEIRPNYQFDVSCQGSVPEAIIAFLESTDFESAIRLAISIGGDSDTIACITGSIAEAFYKEIPDYIVDNSLRVLPQEIIKLIENFSLKFRNES